MKYSVLIFVTAVAFIGNPAHAQPPKFAWAKQAGGTGDDWGWSIELDRDGNFISSGFFRETASFGVFDLTSTGESDMFLARHDVDGNVLWVRQAGGIDPDGAQGLATDAGGNIVVSGYFNDVATFGGTSLTSSGSNEIFLARYDTDGNLLWARRAGGTGNDVGKKVRVDDSGNIIFTGFFSGTAEFGGVTVTSGGRWDIFIAKYDADGEVIWVKTGSGPGNDVGNSIALDSESHIFVTGIFRNTATFGTTTLTSMGDYDIFLAKYDADGDLLWARQAGGPESDGASGIATDGHGNCIIPGLIRGTASFGAFTLSSAGLSDFFLAKYDRDGEVLWATSAGGPEDDFGLEVITDAADNIYASGAFTGPMRLGDSTLTSVDTTDVFVAKFDRDGNAIWATSAGGAGSDRGEHLALDETRAIIVTGSFEQTASFGATALTSAGGRDIFVTKLVPRSSVVATVKCEANLSESCPVTIPLSIDVFGTVPPELLGSFTGRLTWDPTQLEFTSHSGLLAGFAGFVNTDNASAGEIVFTGANASGEGDVVEFLRLDFEVIGPVGASGSFVMEFSAMAAAGSFTNLLPFLEVRNCDYEIVEADVLGDVNGDGLVNSTDALIILSFDVDFAIPEEFLARIDSGVGDVNGDGLTNSTDALIVLSFDVGIEVPFALGERFCP